MLKRLQRRLQKNTITEKYSGLLRSYLGHYQLIEDAPSFLVVGVQKCGTTSLYHYLKSHPAVLFYPHRKEVNYFNRLRRYPDHTWYKTLFRVDKQRNAADIKASGDITPDYCFWPGTMERIHQFKPQMKLIMLVRNPVKRAISHYWMIHGRGQDPLPLRKALAAEETRLESGDVQTILRHSYKTRGHYAEQIQEMYRYFPKEQVLICRTEDFSRDTATTMRAITDFIGVEPVQLPEYKHYLKQQYPAVPDDLRAELQNYFDPHNRALTDLTGIRTDDWD
jgi:hypothetical protein